MKIDEWPDAARVLRDRLLGIKSQGLRTNDRSLVHNVDGVLRGFTDLMETFPSPKDKRVDPKAEFVAPPRKEIELPPISLKRNVTK